MKIKEKPDLMMNEVRLDISTVQKLQGEIEMSDYQNENTQHIQLLNQQTSCSI